jgi:hypothetical protein
MERRRYFIHSLRIGNIVEESVDRKNLKFKEDEGSRQRKHSREVYWDLEYELDLLQEAGVRKIKGMRGNGRRGKLSFSEEIKE